MTDLNEDYKEFYKNMANGDLDDLIELMDTKGFDVNYQNPDKWKYTPLMMTALYDRADVAEELVKRGATLKNPNSKMYTYINVAAQKGSVNMVNFLLSQGVHFNNHTIKLAKAVEDNEDVVNILENWEAEQVIPAFNEAGPHMGVGRIHNEDLIDISEYMGKRGRDYGEGIKRKNKKTKNRKTYKKKTYKRKSMKKKSMKKRK
jgi:ankyrin repeat protein